MDRISCHSAHSFSNRSDRTEITRCGGPRSRARDSTSRACASVVGRTRTNGHLTRSHTDALRHETTKVGSSSGPPFSHSPRCRYSLPAEHTPSGRLQRALRSVAPVSCRRRCAWSLPGPRPPVAPRATHERVTTNCGRCRSRSLGPRHCWRARSDRRRCRCQRG